MTDFTSSKLLMIERMKVKFWMRVSEGWQTFFVAEIFLLKKTTDVNETERYLYSYISLHKIRCQVVKIVTVPDTSLKRFPFNIISWCKQPNPVLMAANKASHEFSLIRQQSVVLQTRNDEHPWRKRVHEAGVPSPSLGCACLGQASLWHRWDYYDGFAWRKKAVCSGKHWVLCCCTGRVPGSWTYPPMDRLLSYVMTCWSWRWRIYGGHGSQRGWVKCSCWARAQDPHRGSVCGKPWCKTEVCGESSKVELSQDCRLLVQESGMYQLIRNR